MFSKMFVMDGGNSTKCLLTIGSSHCGDTWVFADSDYLLLHNYVDQYSNEVHGQAGSLAKQLRDDAADVEYEDDAEAANPISKDCSKNWKAAAKDDTQ
jgi:hypothetical protein